MVDPATLDMAPVCVKPGVMHAQYMPEPFHISDDEGPYWGGSGDYLVRSPGGIYYVCKRRVFHGTFQVGVAQPEVVG